MSEDKKTKIKVESMFVSAKLPAIRKLTINEINKIIESSHAGYWEIIREETKNPMLKSKIEIHGRSVCSLLWINSNKIQFMGVKSKRDAADCYKIIFEELSEMTRGFLQ